MPDADFAADMCGAARVGNILFSEFLICFGRVAHPYGAKLNFYWNLCYSYLVQIKIYAWLSTWNL